MDPRRFDAFVRSLALGSSRRGLLSGLVAAVPSWPATESPDVIVADNRFPTPGNEVDVCDDRDIAAGVTPLPAATPER